MKQQVITLFVLLCLSFLTKAQITVMGSSIPEVGDTLRTMVDNFPQMIEPGSTGGNQTWDFTGLTAPFMRETIFQPAGDGSASDQFPGANAVTLPNASVENYYVLSAHSIHEVGVYGMDPTGLGLDVVGRYSNPLLIKRTPLNYGDDDQLETDLTFPISADDLPDTLINMIPFQFDSIRLKIEIERMDEVDAWGTLVLPDEEAQVLREKRVEVRNGKVEILLGIAGWFDVTDFVAGQFPLDIPQNETIVSYFYFDRQSIEPMAMVSLDSMGNVSRVEYKTGDPTDVESIATDRPNAFVYPNPSFGEVRFELTGIPAGVYKLEVMNILGVPIWENEYYVNGKKVIQVDLTDLRRGTYFYRLVDRKDHTLVTKRLVLIRP